MIPLTMLENGESAVIRRVGGNDNVKQHLSELGFVPGAEVTVVSKLGDNLILNIKESRVALDGKMAMKIMV